MSADPISANTNANIDASTLPMWKRGVKSQVLLKTPVLAKLWDRRRFRWRSGAVITQTVKTQEINGLMQSYGVGEPMTVGRVVNKTKPWFNSKLAQLPIIHDVDEELYNVAGTEEARVDLAAERVNDAVIGSRRGLNAMIYSASATDTGTGFNSIVQALNHDGAYGHVTRTIGSTLNTWWQGASLDDTYTDQDTAATISIAFIRQCIDKMMEHANSDDKSGLFFVLGPANWLKLKQAVDASLKYEPGPMAVKYGFETFTIDNVEIMKDYSLTAANLPNETTPQKWVFGMNADDWEFAIHPRRAFNLTPFVWQGDRANGTDSWLARVLLGGNLCCWKPNGSIWRSNIT